ncbi:hypothetical protein ZIOFF_043316 [Zingiber officinale]|uniref:MADS-box domain-containing protein n=1 Tax=Zingiber officinale TaxID=94328 RepID=A0A8J5KZH4_ZINOF|nr:hypothetical protein ZIOFF_043316 [Zingiber officinale]
MSRKKAKLVRIANDSTRRATFKKRKNGLLKKVSEFATLCNVSTCMIIYNPEEAAMQPEAWPSPPEAARIVVQFRNIPLVEQRQKMLSQESFLSQRIAKLEDQLRRAERKNRELSVSLLVNEALASGRLPVVGIDDAAAIARAADSMLKEVREQINKEAAWQAQSSATALVVEPLDIAMESVQASTWLDSNCAFGKELIMPMPYNNHVGDAWTKVQADSKLKEVRERIYKEAARRALSSTPVVEPLDIESVQASTWLDSNCALGKELIMPTPSINAQQLVPLSYDVDHGNKANWQMENIDAIGGEDIFPVTFAHHANNSWLDGNYGINGEQVLQMPYAGENGNITEDQMQIVPYTDRSNINDYKFGNSSKETRQNQSQAGFSMGEASPSSLGSNAFHSTSNMPPHHRPGFLSTSGTDELTSEDEVARLLKFIDHYSALGFTGYENVDFTQLKGEYRKKVLTAIR